MHKSVASVLFAAVFLVAIRPARAQDVIDVPIASPLNTVGLGTGGGQPTIVTNAGSPTGVAVDNLQPANIIEWKVTCTTPGLYSVDVALAQWTDASSVLAVETRPLQSPDTLYVTRYAAPDTRDYGETNGAWNFFDLGPVEDAAGNVITVPLWSGDNVIRVQNVTGRHNPAYSYPPDLSNVRDRDWDFSWSDVRVGQIRLRRVSDAPSYGWITGHVTADRPAGLPVRRALVTANPLDASPVEPSNFWKNGYYTYTRDDGSYTLNAPVDVQDVKAGRPSSYQAQGSPIVTVSVPPTGDVTADLSLASIFHDDGAGNQVAEVQDVYADWTTGNFGLIAVDGENGYKMGWVDPGDACTMLVDVPRTGYYKVTSSYFNGGNTGTVKVSTAAGASTQDTQDPTANWQTQGLKTFANPLYLVQGTNTITETLVSGASDLNAIHLTMPPVTMTDAVRALQIAAGLVQSGSSDVWAGTLTGGPEITLTDAVRLLQAANGQPL